MFDPIHQARQFMEQLTEAEFAALTPVVKEALGLSLSRYAQAHDGHFHARALDLPVEAERFIRLYARHVYEHLPEDRRHNLGALSSFTTAEEAAAFLDSALPLRPAQPSQHGHGGHGHAVRIRRRTPKAPETAPEPPREEAHGHGHDHAHDHSGHHEHDAHAAAATGDTVQDTETEPTLTGRIEHGARYLAGQYRGAARAVGGKGPWLDGSGFQYDHTEGLHLHGSRVPAEVLAATGLAIAGSFAASRLKFLPGFVRSGLKLATAIPVLRSLIGPEMEHALTHRDTAGGKSDFAKHAMFATMIATDLFQTNDFGLSLSGNVGVAALSLIGRAQSNAAESLKDFGDFLHDFASHPVRRVGEDEEVLPETLRVGERITLPAGATVPVDGVIRRIVGHDGETLDRADIWAKVVNGQDGAVTCAAGESVRQGVQVADERVAHIELEVEKPYALSYLATLARNAEQLGKTPARSQSEAERLANIVTVLSLGGGAITAGLAVARSRNRPEGFSFGALMNDVGEFLAKTSPCGILIAPAALALTRRALASKHQVVSRSLHEFESVAGLDTVLLDWTGTITENNRVTEAFFVGPDGAPLPAAETTRLMHDVAAVETATASQNPTGRAIARQFGKDGIVAEQAGEVIGKGASGTVNGAAIRAGRQAYVAEGDPVPAPLQEWAEARIAEGLSVTYIRHGERWGAVSTDSTIRKDALDTIRHLESQGVEIHIITGDSAETAATKGRALGWNDDAIARRLHAGCLPEDKARLVGELRSTPGPNGKRRVGVVVDGINDFPAVQRATTSEYPGEETGLAFVMHSADYPELAKAASFRIQSLSDVASLREAVREPARQSRRSLFAGGALSALFGVGHFADLKFGAAIGEVLHEVTVGLQYLLTGVRPANKAEREYGGWAQRARAAAAETGAGAVPER